MMRTLLFVLLALNLGGCATTFNPYDGEFNCRAKDEFGRCMDVPTAYQEAVGTSTQNLLQPRVVPPTEPRTPPRDAYLAERDRRMADMFQERATPIMTPPVVLRVWLNAYTTRNDDSPRLHMSRYTFIEVEPAAFVLGDYLEQ